MATEFKRMQQLIGTTADWQANDIVLGDGELGFEKTDTGETVGKVGDGVNTYSNLPTSFVDPSNYYLPYTGTTDPNFMSGDIIFQHTTNGKQFGVSIAEGVFDEALLVGAVTTTPGDVILTTNDGVDIRNYFFQRTGYLQLRGVEWVHSVDGKTFSVGIAEGVPGFDDYLLITANQDGNGDGGIAISSNDGTTPMTWFFGPDGSLGMPDIDYTTLGPLFAVTKAYVDAGDGVVAAGASGALATAQADLATAQADIAQLQADYVALEARVTALETP